MKGEFCQIKVNSFQQSVLKWHYAFQTDLKREVFMDPLTSLLMTDMAWIVFLSDLLILHPFRYTAQPLWWSNGSSFSFILAQDVTTTVKKKKSPTPFYWKEWWEMILKAPLLFLFECYSKPLSLIGSLTESSCFSSSATHTVALKDLSDWKIIKGSGGANESKGFKSLNTITLLITLSVTYV